MTARKLVEVAEALARIRCPEHEVHLPVDAMKLSVQSGEVHCELHMVDGVCCPMLIDAANRTAGL